MRILFLSNLYPPHAHGGYEQWCQEAAVELVCRGHQVHVITSTSDISETSALTIQDGVTVHRCLNPEVQAGLAHSLVRMLLHRNRLERQNIDFVRKVVAEARPDAAMIWGMWNIPRTVPAIVEHLLSTRVTYYFCDYWPSLPTAYELQWQHPSRRKIMHHLKRVGGKALQALLQREEPVHLEYQHPICVSKAVQGELVRLKVSVGHSQVIYGGISTEPFVIASEQRKYRRNSGPIVKLLYAGRLTATKGVHTAIAAVSKVISSGRGLIELNIVGTGEPEYEQRLRSMVKALNLEQHVRFFGKVPQASMPPLMADQDVLIFPSEWQEPFARTVLEAMASGLAVIGTTTGGTPEVLDDGETGLTYAAGDVEALARQIVRVCEDEPLRRQLGLAGQHRVCHAFTFRRMVDHLEGALLAAARNGSSRAIPAGG